MRVDIRTNKDRSYRLIYESNGNKTRWAVYGPMKDPHGPFPCCEPRRFRTLGRALKFVGNEIEWQTDNEWRPVA